MPLKVRTVTCPPHDTRELPDELVLPALVLASLRQAGLVERIGGVLKVARKGGHTGITLFAFSIAFLMSDPQWGIRPYWKRFKRALRRLAAVGGVRRFPSPSSTSRILGELDEQTVETFAEKVLTDVPGLSALLGHPAVVHRCCRGLAWHVLDGDPTAQVWRQRSLEEGDDRPEPVRLAPGVPGRTGHKRGELRIRHIPVQHAGSGLFLAYGTAYDNPHFSVLTRRIVGRAVDVLLGLGVPREQIIFRGDGEYGSAGVAGAVVDLGVHLVTRLARYNLLDLPEIRAKMRDGVWVPVPGGTRRREAMELGVLSFAPDEGSKDAGAPPVELRVIVTRIPCDGKPDHGVLRDGYQLELFGTTLPFDAWPTPELVALYLGRANIENSFAQEDRELNLERTFSFHDPGQAWMTAVGLWLWNFITCAGFLENPPPAEPPEPVAREGHPPPPPVVEEPAPTEPIAEPAPDEAVIAEAAVGPNSEATEPSTDATPAADAPIVEIGEPLLQPTPTADASEPSPVAAASPPSLLDPFPLASADARQVVVDALPLAFADLLRRPGWSFDAAATVLRCPNDKRLMPFSVSQPGQGRPKPQLIVRTDVGACDGCSARIACFGSNRPRTYKQVARAIPVEQAKAVRSFLEANRPGRPLAAPLTPARQPPARSASTAAPAAPAPEPPAEPPPPVIRPKLDGPAGPWRGAVPLFLPAMARRLYIAPRVVARAEVTIRATRGRGRPDHPLIAADADAKRRVRQTWAYREARWRDDRDVYLQVLYRRAAGTPSAASG